jgi:hypothetical protein
MGGQQSQHLLVHSKPEGQTQAAMFVNTWTPFPGSLEKTKQLDPRAMLRQNKVVLSKTKVTNNPFSVTGVGLWRKKEASRFSNHLC